MHSLSTAFVTFYAFNSYKNTWRGCVRLSFKRRDFGFLEKTHNEWWMLFLLVCRKHFSLRFSSSFASLGLVCSLSTAFMTFYRFNSYRSDVAWMCVPGNTFTSRMFPSLFLLVPLSNFLSNTRRHRLLFYICTMIWKPVNGKPRSIPNTQFISCDWMGMEVCWCYKNSVYSVLNWLYESFCL